MYSRETECDGKIPHMNRDEAKLHIDELRRREGKKVHKMHEYTCTWCGFWHVGHKPGTKRRTKRRKVAAQQRNGYDGAIDGRTA